MSILQRGFYFVFLISAVAVAASFGLEIFGKVEPCYLCKVQRMCYFFTMLFAAIGIFSQIKKTMAVLLIFLSLSTLSVASYHFGVQLGVFTDVCAVVSPATLTDFKGMLFEKQQARHSCSSIVWLFGMPVVIWSILFSFTCLAIMARKLLEIRIQNFT